MNIMDLIWGAYFVWVGIVILTLIRLFIGKLKTDKPEDLGPRYTSTLIKTPYGDFLWRHYYEVERNEKLLAEFIEKKKRELGLSGSAERFDIDYTYETKAED